MPKRILLADDSITIRKVVELTFHDTDFRLDAVGSGEDALRALRDAPPDLVLADVVMPAPSGYEICRFVKASDRPVPVLLLVGAFEPFDEKRAREVGSDGEIRKPFDSKALVETVRRLLARPAGAAPREAATPDLPPRAPEKAAVALTEEQVHAIADAVVARLSLDVVREIAARVVPEIAATVIRERIRELEREEREGR
jgi:DNA-binding response OmpR family regulator